MALASTSFFASFDVTDGAQERDISPVLARALLYDLHLLGKLNVDFGSPVYDTVYRWNEDVLNPDTVTVSGSVTSIATTATFTTGHGTRLGAGDLLYVTSATNTTEVVQVTNVATDTASITRSFNSTAAQSIADAATVAIVRAQQEGSDIGTDRTLNPTVRTNSTQIFATNDVLITGSQLARRMATQELRDFLAHQVANRAVEMKVILSRAALYGEWIGATSLAGSDTNYRTMAGLRNWTRDNSGQVVSASATFSLAALNTPNTTVVNLGGMPDTLVIGTDLVASVAAIDNTNRRLLESDRVAGYTVTQVLLAQGNLVDVVVDARVKTGDAFLFENGDVRLLPLNGRGMFVIAATDFADAKKRRILGEWTAEVRFPSTKTYFRNQS